MSSMHVVLFHAAFFMFMAVAGFADSTTFIAGHVFQLQGSTGRSLLQAPKPCPISFEFMNYTIFTSKCKGPQYAPGPCCSAFKEFACPYADALNDITNYCSSEMFTYINNKGNYPRGLFANECREGKQGLACPPVAAPSEQDTNYVHINRSLFPFVALLAGFVLAFLSS